MWHHFKPIVLFAVMHGLDDNAWGLYPPSKTCCYTKTTAFRSRVMFLCKCLNFMSFIAVFNWTGYGEIGELLGTGVERSPYPAAMQISDSLQSWKTQYFGAAYKRIFITNFYVSSLSSCERQLQVEYPLPEIPKCENLQNPRLFVRRHEHNAVQM
jgi:hypothetical protein